MLMPVVVVKSGLWQNSLLRYADRAFISTEEGAIQPLYCAFGPDDVRCARSCFDPPVTELTPILRDAYIVPTAVKAEPNAHAKDDALAKKLWALSEKVVADATSS